MDLIDFIIKSKVSCYAADNKSSKLEFDDGSVGFEFNNNDYRYIDRYYGLNPFAGTEHVYSDKKTLL